MSAYTDWLRDVYPNLPPVTLDCIRNFWAANVRDNPRDAYAYMLGWPTMQYPALIYRDWQFGQLYGLANEYASPIWEPNEANCYPDPSIIYDPIAGVTIMSYLLTDIAVYPEDILPPMRIPRSYWTGKPLHRRNYTGP